MWPHGSDAILKCIRLQGLEASNIEDIYEFGYKQVYREEMPYYDGRRVTAIEPIVLHHVQSRLFKMEFDY